MNRDQPDIVLLVSLHGEGPGASRSGPGYHGTACLAGESWAANLASLLTSTMPSHHGTWTSTEFPGIHVDPLPGVLAAAGYDTRFAGPAISIPLATRCGFDHLVTIDEHASVEAVVDQLPRDGSKPALLTFVVPATWSSWLPALVKAVHGRERPAFVLACGLAPAPSQHKNIPKAFSMLAHPFTAILPGKTRDIDGSSQLWSIVDVAPSLLGLLGITVPWTMGGKDMHRYWLGKSRRSVRFPRERCLLEHGDDSKTTWNGRFTLTVDPTTGGGTIIDTTLAENPPRNLWNDPSFADTKITLLLEMLWAQMDKECMPMPRIAGA